MIRSGSSVSSVSKVFNYIKENQPVTASAMQISKIVEVNAEMVVRILNELIFRGYIKGSGTISGGYDTYEVIRELEQ